MNELELLKQAGRNEYLDPRLSRTSDPTTRKGYRLVTKLTIAGGLLCIPLFAGLIPGLPEIVFDPSSYATLGSIMSGQASTLAKTEALIEQSIKIYSNGVAHYQLFKAMQAQFGNRGNWKPRLYAAVTSEAANMPEWNKAINGNLSAVDSAWTQATKAPPSMSFLEAADNSSFRKANLATMQIMDSAAKACMKSTGNYRAGDQQNSVTRSLLSQWHVSALDAINTSMAQMNLLNGAAAHQVNELAAANSFNTCQTELRLAELKMKRDEIARSLETEANSANGKANNAVAVNPETADPWVNGLLP